MHSTEYLSSIKDHYKDRSYKNIETTIKKMETESKKLDKELCELTFNELCFGFQIFRAKGTLIMRIGQVGQYLDWCVDKGYIEKNVLVGQPIAVIADLVMSGNMKYYSPGEFEKLCQEVRLLSRGIRLETYLRCIYEGIEDGDSDNLAALRLCDVADQQAKLKNGKSIIVRDGTYELMRQCSEKTRGKYPYPDSVFHGDSPDPKGNSKFYSLARELKSDLNVNISDIRDSGLFERVKQAARRRGYNFHDDFLLNNVVSSKGDNTAIAYGRILFGISVEMTWSQFRQKYAGWVEYTKD